MMSPQLKFAAAVGAQLLVIFAIIIYKVSILLSGTDIILRVQPVDPRDFLRGDYVQLRYEINRLDLNAVAANGKFNRGASVYVELESKGAYHIPKAISRTKPETAYVIKGTVTSESGSSLNVSYNIESYFMPEGKARALENVIRGRSSSDVRIGVKVDKSGNALIHKIYVGDKEVDATDFKEVASQAQLLYENTDQRLVQDMEQRRLEMDLARKKQRDESRRSHLMVYQGLLRQYFEKRGSYPSMVGGSLPSDPFRSDVLSALSAVNFPADPLAGTDPNRQYVWLDNKGNTQGYCIYAVSESVESKYYLVHSHMKAGSGPVELNALPRTLEECGVKKAIASIDGYVFIDKNSSGGFDQKDTPFRDADVSLGKIENGLTIVSKIKPNENGFYSLNIFEPGSYIITAQPASGFVTPVVFMYADKNTNVPRVIKGGEKIQDQNFSVVFQ